MTVDQLDLDAVEPAGSPCPLVLAVLDLVVLGMAVTSWPDAERLVDRLPTATGIESARLDVAGEPALVEPGHLEWRIETGPESRTLSVRTTELIADVGLIVALTAFVRVLSRRLQDLAADHAAGHGPLARPALTISHEMRGALTSVVTFSSFLADAGDGELSDECRSFVEVIRRNSNHVLDLLAQPDAAAAHADTR